MRQISDNEFNIAYKCEDNIRISNKAVQPYTNSLSQDEILRCKMIGLWYAMRDYDQSKNIKFTSFLYQRIRWECLRVIYDHKRYRFINIGHENFSIITDKQYTDIHEKLDKLPNSLKDVLIQKYYYNMNLHEIGNINGYSYETARRRILKALNLLKIMLKQCII